MAIRTIRTQGDEGSLTKKSRPVKEMTPRLRELIADMLDTMYEANGVGLAAVQVGILRRIVTIDVGEGPHHSCEPGDRFGRGGADREEGCLSRSRNVRTGHTSPTM